MPKDVRLNLVVPPELGDAQQVLDELREQVAAEEAAIAAERMRTGAGVLGRRTIQRQSWRDSPAGREPRRALRPQVAACNQGARIEALLRSREFVVAYREARTHWLAGINVLFPIGTYWLSRFARVPLAG